MPELLVKKIEEELSEKPLEEQLIVADLKKISVYGFRKIDDSDKPSENYNMTDCHCAAYGCYCLVPS